MLDFKTMSVLAGLMKNKDQLKEAGERIRSKLESLRVEGQAGGGAVRAVVTGTMVVDSIVIDPSVGSAFNANADAQEMAQDLVAEAVNDGIMRAREEAAKVVEAELREMGLGEAFPGLVGGLKGLLP